MMKWIISLLFYPLLILLNCTGSQTVKMPAWQDSIYVIKTPSLGGTGKFYMGREIASIMGAAGASWLERTERQEEEDASMAISKMPLTDSSVVADIGAGTGYYTFRIANKIPKGKIYAVDVQDEMISILTERKQKLNTSNVEVIKGSSQSTNLPSNSIDLAFMVDVYHELEYPHEVLQNINAALKPGGKILLLEYRAEDPKIAIKKLHKMTVKQANLELEANGFKLVQQGEFLPVQHFLLYQKK